MYGSQNFNSLGFFHPFMKHLFIFNSVQIFWMDMDILFFFFVQGYLFYVSTVDHIQCLDFCVAAR